MSRFVKLTFLSGKNSIKFEPIVQNFIDRAGEFSLSETEKIATNNFVKKIYATDKFLMSRILFIHPFLGNTPLSRGMNLKNEYSPIAFSGAVAHSALQTVFNTGKGIISDFSSYNINSNYVSVGVYVRNNVYSSSADIGTNPNTNRLVLYVNNSSTYGLLFDAGNASTGRLSKPNIAISNKLSIGNSNANEISVWNNGIKSATKAGSVSYLVPEMGYNTSGVSNPHEISLGFCSYGLTDKNITDLTDCVNSYMDELGRSV